MRIPLPKTKTKPRPPAYGQASLTNTRGLRKSRTLRDSSPFDSSLETNKPLKNMTKVRRDSTSWPVPTTFTGEVWW